MSKIRLDNHTECPACKNNTLPPSLGGNAITCVNQDCLSIIDTKGEIIGTIEDGVAVYDVNRLNPEVELITNPGSPGVYIKLNELGRIILTLKTIKLEINAIQSLIETIEKR